MSTMRNFKARRGRFEATTSPDFKTAYIMGPDDFHGLAADVDDCDPDAAQASIIQTLEILDAHWPHRHAPYPIPS